MVISSYPMVLVAIAMALGIFTGSLFQQSLVIQILLTLIVVILFIARNKLPVGALLYKDVLIAMAIYIAATLYGININVALGTEKENKNIHAVAVVKEVQSTVKGYKTTLSFKAMLSDSLQYYPYDILAYLSKDGSRSLLPGDEIIIVGLMTPLPLPQNPYVFDYGSYLRRKNIQNICYVKNWSFTDKKPPSFSLFRWAYIVHLRCANILDKYIAHKDNSAIAKGLLLGEKTDIDRETLEVFMYSGLMHLLSVSGYHVGLIYILLSFALAIVYKKKRNTQLSKSLITIATIWCFALVSGMSAAVVRAALLFTLLQLGKTFAKKTEILNLLALTAVVLLVLNPLYLWDIGFQLSYLAMTGLIVAYPKIYALVYFSNKYADAAWKISAVALAAMLFTTPLTIYYFGNFPTYFLISNLYSGIVAFVIMVLSIVILCASLLPFDIIAVWAGKGVHAVIHYVFIMPTSWLVHLPGGSISQLYISVLQSIMLLMCAVAFIVYLYYKNMRYLYAALLGVVAVIVVSYYYTFSNTKVEQLQSYTVKDKVYIAIRRGLITDIITDDSLGFDKNFAYTIAPVLRATHNKLGSVTFLDGNSYVFYYKEKKLDIIARHGHKSRITHTLIDRDNSIDIKY